jgi:hypothetical protein
MECENVKAKTADQGEEFFSTGLEKYLDAKSAVAMFEKEVQRRVKNVVTRHHSELAKLFGEDWVLRDYFESGMPDYMWLGQQVVFKGFGRLYFYLSFWRDKGGGACFSPSVMFWRERVTLLGPLWTSVAAIQSAELEFLNDRFWLNDSQPSNDWASCATALDALIRDWIKLWHKLGGLPKYLAAQRQPK